MGRDSILHLARVVCLALPCLTSLAVSWPFFLPLPSPILFSPPHPPSHPIPSHPHPSRLNTISGPIIRSFPRQIPPHLHETSAPAQASHSFLVPCQLASAPARQEPSGRLLARPCRRMHSTTPASLVGVSESRPIRLHHPDSYTDACALSPAATRRSPFAAFPTVACALCADPEGRRRCS